MRNRDGDEDATGVFIYGAMYQATGAGRAANEDYAGYVVPEPGDPRAARGALALIADGMGGHAGGEVASAVAGDIVLSSYYETDHRPDKALAVAFRKANAAIYEQAQACRDQRGMGTTCTAVAVRNGVAWLAHVGDSRLYLLREGDLSQLSEDHSLVGELVRKRTISSEQARRHPDRNVLVRALGTHSKVEVDIWRKGLPLAVSDVLLLCSDGLSDMVDDAAITDVLSHMETPYDACRALVAAALDAGGQDDVSVGVFALSAEPRAAPPAVRVTRSSAIG